MKIIVGIGNPGKQYAGTRHNVGFLVVDRLADWHGLASWRRRFHSSAAEGRMSGNRTLLMKPETYVNETGRAVRDAMVWSRVSPQNIMIVCDDFNLPLGRLRIRGKGSSGGHKGLESVIARLATDDVPRLRIGIGAEKAGSDRDFVLSTFDASEREVINEAVERAARALEMWLASGLERCQNTFNAGPEPPSETKQEEAHS